MSLGWCDVVNFLRVLKRWAFGRPIATDSARPQILRTRVALPVFGAGVLSAAVYAPDAVIDALVRGDQQGAIPAMAAAVLVVMAILAAAYASNVRARPDARADYGLVRDQLGTQAGVVTGAALLIDYVFTVAVSVAAMAHIITFAVPGIAGWERALAVGAVAIMTLVTLRGIRERARIAITVWFGFLLVMAIMLAVGAARHATSAPTPLEGDAPTTWAILAAYAGAIASGAVMITGIEHLASSAPYHAQPQAVRAGRTLIIAVMAAGGAFVAVLALTWAYRISGDGDGPIMMRVADRIFVRDAAVWVVAAFAIAVLFAAAAAVFRRFSGLSSLLARDSYLPRQLAMLNDRLVYRGGVLTVGSAGAVVVLAVGADVIQLVHMYVIGVFTSVVLSQIAMVRYCGALLVKEADGRARLRLHARRGLHAVAAVVAAAVWLVVATVNFLFGAWVAIVVIVLVVALMRSVRRHYDRVRQDLAPEPGDSASALPSATHGLVLVAQLHRPALRALAYAKAARHSSLEAVGVQIEREPALRLQELWGSQDLGVPLVILDSPYRDIIGPVMDYVKSIHRHNPREVVVVYVPEYIVGTWWERLLHNRSTVRLRSLLLREPGVVVAAVPWHLESAREPRHQVQAQLESEIDPS
ncbi:MAG: DNA-binding protein [Demequina sp.]